MKKIIVVIIILAIASLSIFLYPIIGLALNDQKVYKALLADTYYVKITSLEGEYTVFTEYMESHGWFENVNKQMGAGHLFEKNEETKHVSNSDIKTVIIDGKLNLKYFIKK